MKNIKLLLVSMLAAVFSGCMDHHDDRLVIHTAIPL